MILEVVKKIFRVLRSIFLRKHLREINFLYGTLTFKECIRNLMRLKREGEDIIHGSYIREFEQKFSDFIGASSAFSFGQARIALYAILKAIGIQENNEVILPAYTCVVVPNAVIYCRARPRYVDIDSRTFNIDISKIEDKINKRTKAIIAQHTFGLPVDMDAIVEIAKKHNLKVIEDCAAALGAEYKGKKVGSLGDAAFFSLEQTKVITTGLGGIAVTHNPEIANALEKIQKETPFPHLKTAKKRLIQITLSCLLYHPSNFWWGKWVAKVLHKIRVFIPSYLKEELEGKKPSNYPYRLSNAQALLGLSQLENIHTFNKHRINLANRYEEILKKIGVVSENSYDKKSYKHIYLRYPFVIKDRDKVTNFFAKHQIELGEWFNSVIHPISSHLERFSYQKGECPVAEKIAESCVNLPTHWKILSGDQRRIEKVLARFFKANPQELPEVSDEKIIAC